MLKRFLLILAAVCILNHEAAAQVTISITNAGSTGTTNGSLAKLTGAPSTAVISATSDTADSIIGVVVSGGGTTGSALIATSGIASCTFDASGVVAGHWVINSTATGGDCADGGVMAAIPGAQVVGIAIATVGGGAANMIVVPSRPSFATFVGQTNGFTGPQSFAQVNGTAYAPSLTSNNYAALATDCGKTLMMPTGTTPTVTLPNINPATGECTIKIIQTTSGAALYTFAAASGGSLASGSGCTGITTKAQYAQVIATLFTPSVSTAKWDIGGDCL